MGTFVDLGKSHLCTFRNHLILEYDVRPLYAFDDPVRNGFKGMTEPYAIVANCCNHPHDPVRTGRLDLFGNEVPYECAVRQH